MCTVRWASAKILYLTMIVSDTVDIVVCIRLNNNIVTEQRNKLLLLQRTAARCRCPLRIRRLKTHRKRVRRYVLI